MAISLVNTVGAATASTYVGLTAAQAFIRLALLEKWWA